MDLFEMKDVYAQQKARMPPVTTGTYICVLCYIPYVGLNGVQLCDRSSSCVYCDCELCNSCFQRFWSKSWLGSTSYFLSTWGASWIVVVNNHRIVFVTL